MTASALVKLGFYVGTSGAHAGRSLMLDDLDALLQHAPEDARNDWFSDAIVEKNLLAKATVNNRDHANRRMRQLYGLDSALCLYRNFRRLYLADSASRSAIAVLMAMARDALFRGSAQLVRHTPVGTALESRSFRELLDTAASGRLGKETLSHACTNVFNSWTQAGYMTTGPTRTRTKAAVGPAACAFALFLGWLEGARGRLLFETEWAKTLDRNTEDLIELATTASRRGMLELLNAGGVIEVRFPGWLTEEEQKLL